MLWKQNTDVLVAGAGPVGLFAALLLGRQGVGVQIIDEEWRTGAQAYALALHPLSLQLMAESDMLDDVVAAGRTVDRLALYDGPRRAAEIDLTHVNAAFPHVLVVGQDALEDLLLQHAARAGVHVQWERHIASIRPRADGVLATVDELERESIGYAVPQTEYVTERTRWVEAGFLIGADGYRSTVRRAAGIEFPEVTPPEFYAIFEFRCPAVPNEIAVVLDGPTANVLWPLPGERARWSFQIHADDIPLESRIKSRMASKIGSQVYPYLTRDDLLTLVAQRAPWFPQECVGPITWSLGVRFEHRLATSYGSDRVWLAGDAAHLAGPIGVHSMNMGLREAYDLATTVGAILKRGQDAAALEQYFNQQYREEWRQLLGVTPFLEADGDADPFVREHVGQIIAALPATGEELVALAGQLHLHVKQEASMRGDA